jgi:hypothetical protein
MWHLHRAVRIASLVVFVAGLGLLAHRLRRTPDQEELRRYVEVELPRLRLSEYAIFALLSRLNEAPGLSAAEARVLLIDDLIPRLVRLRKQAEAPLAAAQLAARPLAKEYIEVVDQLVDACRTSVRVIDDPKMSTQDGAERSRNQFAAARRTYLTWQQRVEKTCILHRLTVPPLSSH